VAAREKREEAGCCTRAPRRLVLRVKWQRDGLQGVRTPKRFDAGGSVAVVRARRSGDPPGRYNTKGKMGES